MNQWHKCYDDSWQGIIVPEAFAHPAKMSYGLTKRIFKHALSEAWIKPGDVVVDPFGGIGSTGIIGASMGLRVVCVELEEKFVELGKQNFKRNQKAFEVSHFGHSYQPQIIQGDSRKLSAVIAGADCLISSPPYSEQPSKSRTDHGILNHPKACKCNFCLKNRNNAGMSQGYRRADCVVGSPPYSDRCANDSQRTMARTGKIEWMNEGDGKTYGQTPGQLGAMKPGSVEAIISSPPFEDSMVESGDPNYAHKFHGNQKDYGNTAGNIGNDKGQTFWQAAQQIVSECHKILKPGGHAIWVVKAFVRKGKTVDFPGDWRRLCESQGFTTVCEHHAMLIKETRHSGLFEEIIETKERKSFFRRLAEKKGSPKIDYEVVLCMRK